MSKLIAEGFDMAAALKRARGMASAQSVALVRVLNDFRCRGIGSPERYGEAYRLHKAILTSGRPVTPSVVRKIVHGK